MRDRPGRWTRRRAVQAALALPLALAGCGGRALPRAPDAPWHHTDSGFRNPPGSPARGGDAGEWMDFFYRRMIAGGAAPPLPEGHVLADAEAQAGLARHDGGDSLTWLGHAAFLIRLGGLTVLTDPFLARHASPLPPFGPRRFAPPGLGVERLPPIDLLLVSHNHYEHLDLPTLEALPGRGRITAAVPLGLGHYLRGRGYGAVHELDWHERLQRGGVTLTALPAIHFSKRGLFDRNRTLWASFMLEAGGRRVLFAGDTAYGPVWRETGARHGPFDMALLPIGAYAPRALMRASHTTPEEAVALARDLAARRLVAMHWGTIRLTDEPPFEPPQRFRAAAQAAGYGDDDAWLMAIGETRGI